MFFRASQYVDRSCEATMAKWQSGSLYRLLRFFIAAVLFVAMFGCVRNGEDTVEVPARLAARGEFVPCLATFREYPIQFGNVGGLGDCVTDEQMSIALNASLPLWHPPSVPSLVHELKLWGRGSVFTKEQVGGEGRTGAMMIETLLSDPLCRERTVRLGDGDGGSYLLDSPYGVHPIQSGSYDAIEYRGEPHFGKLAMLMGLTNLPISTPVTTASGRVCTIADLLQDTVMNFGWQQELEFVGCALAYWLPPQKSWTNKFDETFTFDELLKKILAVPLGKGCCGGTHATYTVVTLLRVDEQESILSPATRKLAEDWLRRVANVLTETQNPDGTWPRDWGATGQKGFLYGDEVLDNITLVGHHLEWIALSQEHLRPPKSTVTNAVAALAEQISLLPEFPRRSFKTILPCSHAAKAMCLMRGVEPYQMWLNLSNASAEAKEEQ